MAESKADTGEAPGPLEEALASVGDRWTLLVVAALLDGPRRFGDLQRALPAIAPNVLSARLRHLEEQGLVVAQPYSKRPPGRAPPRRGPPAARCLRDAAGGALVLPDVRAPGGRRAGGRGRRPLRMN